jgi:hypothetical protein
VQFTHYTLDKITFPYTVKCVVCHLQRFKTRLRALAIEMNFRYSNTPRAPLSGEGVGTRKGEEMKGNYEEEYGEKKWGGREDRGEEVILGGNCHTSKSLIRHLRRAYFATSMLQCSKNLIPSKLQKLSPCSDAQRRTQ